MPPRKRARISPSSHASVPNTSTPATPSSANQPPAPASTSTDEAESALLNDPWTPEQTTTLFRAIIRSKPTGIHKHMHMLQIAQTVQSQSGGSLDHLRMPNIWQKLGALYELDALNEREEHANLNDLVSDLLEEKEKRLKKAKPGAGRDAKPAKQKTSSEEDFALTSEFWLPELEDPEMAERLQQRRLKVDDDEESNDEEEPEKPSVAKGTKSTRGRGGRGGRQSLRGAKTEEAEATPSNNEEEEEEADEEDEGDEQEESEAVDSTAASSPAPVKGTRSAAARNAANARGKRGRGRGGRKR